MLKIKIALVLMCSLFNRQATGVQTSQEYAIKATFLFNFTKFVTWPETALEEGAPFIIGIAGKDPFGNSLTTTVKDEKVQGHSIILRYYPTAEKVEPCHILFINLTDRDEIRKVLEKVKSWNVLTVGEQLILEKQGGMVRFVTEQHKTKLRINATAAQASGLVISSKLLKLAEIIEPREKKL